MSKPPFDPTQPFDAGAKPAFDPNQPFSSGDQSDSGAQDQGINWKQVASDYLVHPAIEGGAMTVGGAAGGILGSAAGPVGTAAGAIAGSIAMYPPAHQFANAVDQYIGANPQPSNGVVSDLGQGAKIEATSAALKPVLGAVGNLLPGAKSGEALSGTPASNLRRAYKGGFSDTYLNPKPMAQSAEEYGIQSNKVLQNYLTPEEQAAMMVSPTGQANQKISDVYTNWLKGNPISAPDAVAAKQAISTVFPNPTAKNASKISRLTDFENHLDGIIGKVAPDFKIANDNYAASKLRSQLLMPARVNKNNPNEFSKLGAMLELATVAGGAGLGQAGKVVGGVIGTSPLAMGLISSMAGSTNKGMNSALSNPTISKAIADYVASKYPKGQQ